MNEIHFVAIGGALFHLPSILYIDTDDQQVFVHLNTGQTVNLRHDDAWEKSKTFAEAAWKLAGVETDLPPKSGAPANGLLDSPPESMLK